MLSFRDVGRLHAVPWCYGWGTRSWNSGRCDIVCCGAVGTRAGRPPPLPSPAASDRASIASVSVAAEHASATSAASAASAASTASAASAASAVQPPPTVPPPPLLLPPPSMPL